MQRQGTNRAHVGGDVLAGRPIAAGRGAHEDAVFVGHRDRKPIELRFGRIVDLVTRAQPLANSAIESAQIFVGERIVEREHRHAVPHLGEFVGRRDPHALGRRIGRDEFGMLGLERAQLTQQSIPFGVRDLRVVEDVVTIVVIFDVAPQLRSATTQGLGRRPRAHGHGPLTRSVRRSGSLAPHFSEPRLGQRLPLRVEQIATQALGERVAGK